MCPGSPRCLFTGKLGRAPRWTVTGMYPYGSKTPGGGEKPGSRVTLPKGAPATPRTEHLHHARRDSCLRQFDSWRIIKPNFEPVQKTGGDGTHTASRATETPTASGVLRDTREPHETSRRPRQPGNADSARPRRTKPARARPRQPPQCLRQRPMTHTQKRPPPANPIPEYQHCTDTVP